MLPIELIQIQDPQHRLKTVSDPRSRRQVMDDTDLVGVKAAWEDFVAAGAGKRRRSGRIGPNTPRKQQQKQTWHNIGCGPSAYITYYSCFILL